MVASVSVGMDRDPAIKRGMGRNPSPSRTASDGDVQGHHLRVGSALTAGEAVLRSLAEDAVRTATVGGGSGFGGGDPRLLSDRRGARALDSHQH